MPRKNTKLCNRIVISQAVKYVDGIVYVNLPANSYVDGQEYCIVIAQEIPPTSAIGAPVVIRINDGENEYPLVKTNCAPVTACGIRTRTAYPVKVATFASGAVFKMLCTPSCSPSYDLRAINGKEKLEIPSRRKISPKSKKGEDE